MVIGYEWEYGANEKTNEEAKSHKAGVRGTADTQTPIERLMHCASVGTSRCSEPCKIQCIANREKRVVDKKSRITTQV